MGEAKRRRKLGKAGFHRDRSKTIPLSDEAVDALRTQREVFRSKFGREPGPNDPAFFDQTTSAAMPAQPGVNQVAEALKGAGFPERFIYAFRKTERLVTEGNRHLLSSTLAISGVWYGCRERSFGSETRPLDCVQVCGVAPG